MSCSLAVKKHHTLLSDKMLLTCHYQCLSHNEIIMFYFCQSFAGVFRMEAVPTELRTWSKCFQLKQFSKPKIEVPTALASPLPVCAERLATQRHQLQRYRKYVIHSSSTNTTARWTIHTRDATTATPTTTTSASNLGRQSDDVQHGYGSALLEEGLLWGQLRGCCSTSVLRFRSEEQSSRDTAPVQRQSAAESTGIWARPDDVDKHEIDV